MYLFEKKGKHTNREIFQLNLICDFIDSIRFILSGRGSPAKQNLYSARYWAMRAKGSDSKYNHK